MALELFRTGESKSLTAASVVPSSQSAPPPPALPVLRFGLRQLFWTVTVLSLLCAAIFVNPRGPMPLVLVLAALVVTAHVAATAIGSRLRRHALESREWEALHAADRAHSAEGAEHSGDLATSSLPPPSPWYLHGSTSLRWLPKCVLAGAVVGGCLGLALFLTNAIGHRASLAGILVGALSLAVVGGWFAFLSGSFYAIFRHGLRDAMAQQQSDESRGSPASSRR